MDKTTEAFEESLRRFLAEAQQLCYVTRAVELQSEARRGALEFTDRAEELKATAIRAADEDTANRLLAIEYILRAIMSELDMWIALKEDRMNDAWDDLIGTQLATRSAMQAHNRAGHLQGRAERLLALEKLVFPPQIFMSIGAVVTRATCSICGEPYDACDHIVGRPYMGRLCARRIEECELEEVSIVAEPADRRCRLMTIEDRDTLTWRPAAQ